MNTFPPVSIVEEIIYQIVLTPSLHARWLNTLSYLENCGARKIALFEHPIEVHDQILKHAAEEFRHSYFLKKQLAKIENANFQSYCVQNLLGGINTLRYLDKLEIGICRFLKDEFKLCKRQLKNAAYLLVTYAIEKRAAFLYPLYQRILTQTRSSISMRSIIAEEDQHLADIEKDLQNLKENQLMMQKACTIEHCLFAKWINDQSLCQLSI